MELKRAVKEFCEERDWDQFHSAKELTIGIVTEGSELLEILRFKSDNEIEALFKSSRKREIVEDEMADVLFFVVRLAQRYDIDLTSALRRKIKKNEIRYPVSKAKGSNKKYDEM